MIRISVAAGLLACLAAPLAAQPPTPAAPPPAARFEVGQTVDVAPDARREPRAGGEPVWRGIVTHVAPEGGVVYGVTPVDTSSGLPQDVPGDRLSAVRRGPG